MNPILVLLVVGAIAAVIAVVAIVRRTSAHAPASPALAEDDLEVLATGDEAEVEALKSELDAHGIASFVRKGTGASTPDNRLDDWEICVPWGDAENARAVLNLRAGVVTNRQSPITDHPSSIAGSTDADDIADVASDAAADSD